MDKYAQIKRIGEGSFGKALLVKEKESGKYYVIKEVNIQKMSRKEKDDARKEVQVLSQMKHSNIVSYQESFEEGGKLYIAMDYCDGGDLYKKINDQKGKLFTEDQILDWFVQICLAIKHVHDRKILHRDIKSQNIFLMRNGIVKLGDFGIAKVLRNTQELARTCIGTPYYLSPEICENRPYNNKSDIWALGCVLYELATLKHAFEAGNMRNLVVKIIRGSYPPISSRYSRDIRNLADLMFKRQPQHRPSVNAILRMAFIQRRIEKFLSQTMLAEEFSHTVLHRKNVAQGGRDPLHPILPLVDPVAPQQRPAAKKVAPAAPVKYDPGLVYGVKKPSNPRPAEKRGIVLRPKLKPYDSPPGVHAARKPISGALAEKKKQIDERQRLQREKMKQENKQLAVKQQEMAAKQKQARMNEARRAGWKGTLNSGEIGKDVVKNQSENIPKKLEQQHNQPGPTPVSAAVAKAEGDRQLASEAAEKAHLVQEYMMRKKEAAAYKARGQQWLLGAAAAVNAPQPSKQRYEEARKPIGRDSEEKNYLARLEAIRKQNYEERKRIQQRVAMGYVDPKPKSAEKKAEHLPPRPNLMLDPEYRRKKMAALKAQADEQAELLKKELAEKRQQQRQQVAAVNRSPQPLPLEGAAAVVGSSPTPQRKTWDEPGTVKLPKQYDNTASVIKDTATGVVFIKPEDNEETSNKQPRRAWGRLPPAGDPFAGKMFEGAVTRNISREDEDDILATGAPLIPIVSEANLTATEGNAVNVDKDVTRNTVDCVTETVVDDVTKRVIHDATNSVTDDVTKRVIDDVTKRVVDDVTNRIIHDATKSVTDNVTKPVMSNITTSVAEDKIVTDDTNNRATKNIAKGTTEVPSVPLEGVSPSAMVSPSKIHDAEASSQGNQEENKQLQEQPDHLVSKPPVREAWKSKGETVGQSADKEAKLLSVGGTEAAGEGSTKQYLKVEDVEDDQQEIMEYVAVLAEEEEEGKGEEEESFHTPKASSNSMQLTRNLCSGKFDTHHTILKTCSLPDLRSLFATDLSGDDRSSLSGRSSNGGGESGNESDEELGDDDDDDVQSPLAQQEEEDDFQKMIQTLKDVIDDNKFNQLASPKRPLPVGLSAANDAAMVFAVPPADDEEWEESDSEEQGPSKKDAAAMDEGSVFARLEETRAELESQLGMDVFMEAYSECQLLQDESEDISDNTLQRMTAVIGNDNQQYTLPLLHLVIADSAYCDANKDPSKGSMKDDFDDDSDDEGTHEP